MTHSVHPEHEPSVNRRGRSSESYPAGKSVPIRMDGVLAEAIDRRNCDDGLPAVSPPSHRMMPEVASDIKPGVSYTLPFSTAGMTDDERAWMDEAFPLEQPGE